MGAPALDGVVGTLRNLKLSDAEKKGIKIGKRQACSAQVGKLQAVGKILSERPAKAEYLGRTLGGIWSPFTGVDCKNLGRNRFLFSFHDEASKKKALDGGPWTFNKDLLVMEEFVPSKTIDDYDFNRIPIWVRAYGIPMGMMNTEIGDLVGEQIGEVLEVDIDEDGYAMGEFMRIKVRMDITVPLMRFTTLEFEEEEVDQMRVYEEMPGEEDEEKKRKKEGEEKIISFKYEHLPDFCYNCGVIGHTEKACPTKSRVEGSRQFGPWLRAVILKGSPSGEKSRKSSDRVDFWVTNGAGSKGNMQGSDSPFWRKSILIGNDVDRPTSGEEKEEANPVTTAQQDQIGPVGGNRVVVGDNAKFSEIKSTNLEVGFFNKTAAITYSDTVQKENDFFKQKSAENENTQGAQSQPEDGVQSKKESNGTISCKSANLGTFKRIRRGKDEHQWKQPVETVLKKRNVDLMVGDLQTEKLKRARMEVDGEGDKEENTKSVIVNAGLQGQPGESK